MPQPDTQTIAVTARSRSRFARLKVRRLGASVSRLSRVTQSGTVPRQPLSPAAYTQALAIELLIGTAELPGSKRGLLTQAALPPDDFAACIRDLAQHTQPSQPTYRTSTRLAGTP